jgi:cobalamin biosynthesis Mg chelatase CobN
MNSALVAAMMIGARETVLYPNLAAGDVYQPYLMDTLDHRRVIMKFMGENDSAGNDAVDQVDMQWSEHFTSSAAQEAQRGADEIRQLKIRLADTEAKLRNVQNNVFDLAMELAAKMQNTLTPAQRKN